MNTNDHGKTKLVTKEKRSCLVIRYAGEWLLPVINEKKNDKDDGNRKLTVKVYNFWRLTMKQGIEILSSHIKSWFY